MRKWLIRALIVGALGLGLWGVRDLIGIFAADLTPDAGGEARGLLISGLLKLLAAIIIGTLAIKRS